MRLIDADAFVEANKDIIDNDIDTNRYEVTLRELINEAPTAERQHGEWGKWVISEVRCPECLEYFDTDCYSKEEMNKCPNCGASMSANYRQVTGKLKSEEEGEAK